jgi:hypothetical protein
MIKNFFFTILIFLLSVGIFIFTLTQLDPLAEQANIALIVFYLSLFFGTSSIFTLISFFLNEIFAKENLGDKYFFIAMLRGLLISFFITIITLLQMLRLFGVLEAILLFVFLLLIELIFLSVGNK